MIRSALRWCVTQVRRRLLVGVATPADLDRLYERVAGAIQIQAALSGAPVLKPMPGWALSTDSIAHILADLQERKAPAIVEFGSGQSTVIFAAWLRQRGAGSLVSFEHDPAHAAAIRRQLAACGLAAQVDLRVVPVIDRPAEDGLPACQSYALPDNAVAAVDVAIVDGPPYLCGDATRYHPLRFAFDRLAPGGTLYLDDTVRVAERNIVQALLAHRPDAESQELKTSNGTARITRKATR